MELIDLTGKVLAFYIGVQSNVDLMLCDHYIQVHN